MYGKLNVGTRVPEIFDKLFRRYKDMIYKISLLFLSKSLIFFKKYPIISEPSVPRRKCHTIVRQKIGTLRKNDLFWNSSKRRPCIAVSVVHYCRVHVPARSNVDRAERYTTYTVMCARGHGRQ